MIFGNWPIEETEGAVLGYAIAAGSHNFRKGTLLTSDHIAVLKHHGLTHIFAARLEKDDLGENEAALAVGKLLISENLNAGPSIAGRVNLFAQHAGLFHANVSDIDAINLLDPRISIATLHNNCRVERGQMVATVKIIPFAIPKVLIEKLQGHQSKAIDVRPFRATRIGLIQSRLPSIRETIFEKTKNLISSRVERNQGSVSVEHRVAHEQTALSSSIREVAKDCDIILIFSASSIADEADIVPRAIINCGGEILRMGVPVDPGNLLVLAKLGDKYIVVAPGSARSARENSLDWILDRLMAGMQLSANDLGRMGVGGLVL
ncbi:molybdopterin-binding protein [Brucella pseudogrignonensis]|uniref:molybdopterin-binding protein n=1 Tax=Brucella pseudogrignonensis TaxID=419475 RepID=UPI0028BA34B1|nr:molybdopterin-binding protein [Brucella pseudogrignonensis]MDT6939888.1 molybdopterin-binding protein [Brucella pseudogrignonensis]